MRPQGVAGRALMIVGQPVLRDLCIDPFGAVEACNAYAVVAVFDEVHVAQLVEDNGRQFLPEPERAIHTLPTLAGAQRHKPLIEPVVLSRASDGARQLHRIPAAPDAAVGAPRPPLLFEREQCPDSTLL